MRSPGEGLSIYEAPFEKYTPYLNKNLDLACISISYQFGQCESVLVRLFTLGTPQNSSVWSSKSKAQTLTSRVSMVMYHLLSPPPDSLC